MGVDDGRTDEFETALFEVFAHGVGLGAGGGVVVQGVQLVDDGRALDKAPTVGVERSKFALDFEEAPGVVDSSVDFEAVADNAGVLQKFFYFGIGEAGDFFRVELGEGFAIILAFA